MRLFLLSKEVSGLFSILLFGFLRGGIAGRQGQLAVLLVQRDVLAAGDVAA